MIINAHLGIKNKKLRTRIVEAVNLISEISGIEPEEFRQGVSPMKLESSYFMSWSNNNGYINLTLPEDGTIILNAGKYKVSKRGQVITSHQTIEKEEMVGLSREFADFVSGLQESL